VEFARFLVQDVGIAVVPGSSFYSQPRSGTHQVRFAFPKRMETLERASTLLTQVPERLRLSQTTTARH
jgi:aminotransferase